MRIGQIIAIVVLLSGRGALGADSAIRLNSLGFLPGSTKMATIVAGCSDFAVKRASDGATIYTAVVTGPFYQGDVKQNVWIADFSVVSEKDKCYLDVPGVGRSADFEIGDAVYDFAFYTAMRGFYLWRCGTEVQGEHNGQTYAHAACHLNDAYQDYLQIPNPGRDPSRRIMQRDGTGGWHDAGDYGKYVVNAGVTVGCLFLAWDHFEDKIKDISLNLPDTAPGYPDFLKEIKWETDWLLKMPYSDGSGKVSHKLTRLAFESFIMPEKDTGKRYFTDWSSAAVADFVAMMAMAARYFRPYDPNYAQLCLNAAGVSYAFLTANPQPKAFVQGAFQTGGYQTGDSDDRLWAAAEMWETTGRAECLKDFETRAATGSARKIDQNWDWGSVRNLGMFTYVLSEQEGRNPVLLEQVRRDVLTVADVLVVRAQKDVYARPLAGSYYWGCNGTVARQVLNLQVANRLSPRPEYLNAALDAIGHLFGRNYYGRSYVTGLGQQPPMNPHDRRSGSDGIRAPWPGYLVGGGHTAAGWSDTQADYETNEIAINWQGALVYALAGFVSNPPQDPNEQGVPN